MDYSLILPVVRHLLQAVGGGLITFGYLDESMLETFIGFGLNASALVWWAGERWLKSRPSHDDDPMDGIQ